MGFKITMTTDLKVLVLWPWQPWETQEGAWREMHRQPSKCAARHLFPKVEFEDSQ